MPKFKNIRVKMANGKSRIQRAQVLRSGKLKFVKNIGRKTKSGAKKAGRAVKKRVSGRKKQGIRTPVRRNTTKRSNNNMVGKSVFKKIPLINNPIVRKVFIAAGAVSIIVSILALISPRAAAAANSTVGRGVIGLATGDVVGAVSNVAIPLLRGGGLGNLLGGTGNGNAGNGGGNTGGFA